MAQPHSMRMKMVNTPMDGAPPAYTNPKSIPSPTEKPELDASSIVELLQLLETRLTEAKDRMIKEHNATWDGAFDHETLRALLRSYVGTYEYKMLKSKCPRVRQFFHPHPRKTPSSVIRSLLEYETRQSLERHSIRLRTWASETKGTIFAAYVAVRTKIEQGRMTRVAMAELQLGGNWASAPKYDANHPSSVRGFWSGFSPDWGKMYYEYMK